MADADAGPGLKERLKAYERQLILDALERAGGNQRRAAMLLGCLPTTLNRRCDASACAEGRGDGRLSPEDSTPEDVDGPY